MGVKPWRGTCCSEYPKGDEGKPGPRRFLAMMDTINGGRSDAIRATIASSRDVARVCTYIFSNS